MWGKQESSKWVGLQSFGFGLSIAFLTLCWIMKFDFSASPMRAGLISCFLFVSVLSISYLVNRKRITCGVLVGILSLLIIYASPFYVFSPDEHLVLIYPDKYEVIRGDFKRIDIAGAFDIEEVRKVSIRVLEEEFSDPKTRSYHFIKFRVESELAVDRNNDYAIYVASRESPNNSWEVESYIVKLLRGGETDKTRIERLALEHFKENPPGPWVPTNIEILSLSKV